MKVWYFDMWGSIPVANEKQHRSFRQNLITHYLIQKGHEVVWFTSAFDHKTKQFRFDKTTDIIVNDINIVLIKPKLIYRNNISIKRILNHIELAIKMNKYIKSMDKPDIILTSYPAIEIAYIAVQYAKRNDIPIVIDVRDLWPDIFEAVLQNKSSIIANIGNFCLTQYKYYSKNIFQQSTAITGVTDEFVKFGLKYADREKLYYDKAFPFGYPKISLSKQDKEKSLKKLNIDFSKFTICFFGTIGKQFDFQPIIEVSKIVKDIQFVICGNGEYFEELQRKVEKNDSIILPGWVNKNEILTIMSYSNIGIAPYVNRYDFLKSLPNKSIEYISNSLPILSSISGVMGELIYKNNCGFVYKDVKALEEKIILLKNNQNMLNEMSKNAKHLFEERFSADRVYGDMIEYLELIAKE